MAWAKWRDFLDYRLFDMARARRSPSATRSAGSAASSRATATTASRRTCPWAMAYPDGTVPTTDEVHPTPIYEIARR